MFHHSGYRIDLLVLILAVASLAVVPATYALYRTPKVNANGLTIPIAEGDSGPYEYLVGIWPPNPGVGELHMAITVTADQHAVTDAVVNVLGDVADGSDRVGPVPASSFFQPWVYELNLNLDQPDDWMFQIEINGPLEKTLIEAALEVAGDLTPEEHVSEERPVTNGAQAAQTPNEEAGGNQGVTDPITGDGGLNWALIAVPLAILGFGVAVWAFRRHQNPEPRAAGRGRTPPSSRRRRR